MVDDTSITSTVSWYSSTRSLRVFSRLLMSISLAALVRTRALPVRMLDTQWHMHKESVFTCSTLLCHWRVKLMPFNTASSLTSLICWASFSGCSQQASSCTVLCLYRVQFLAIYTPISMGWIILLYSAHSLRHHALVEGILCFVIPALHDQTCSPLEYSTSHTELSMHREVLNKPPTHREYHLSCDVLGASETMLPCLHHNSPGSITTASPSTHSPSFNHSGSLHSSPNWARCFLTQVVGTTSSLI